MHCRIKQLLFATVPYTLVLSLFGYINYMDLKLIKELYLPIFLIAAIAIFFKKYYLGHIFLISSQIGLIVDYIVNLSNGAKPNMFGGFLNVFIIAIVFLIGAIIQVIIDKRHQLS